MSLVEAVHERGIHPRRVHRLAELLAPLLPGGADVLDVGCGDGRVAAAIAERRSDLTLRGLDIARHPQAAGRIPVEIFDGRTLPVADGGADAVLFVDVLHHAEDPSRLLREAARAARQAVVIKDHTRDGLFAAPTLRLMDRVGNARHGVPLPYAYWSRGRWRDELAAAGLDVEEWIGRCRLYPWPASWVFDRSLHCVVKARPRGRPRWPAAEEPV